MPFGKRPDPAGKNAPSPCTVFGELDSLYRRWDEPSARRPPSEALGPPRSSTPEIKLHRIPFVVSSDVRDLETQLATVAVRADSCHKRHNLLQEQLRSAMLARRIEQHEKLLFRDSSTKNAAQVRATTRALHGLPKSTLSTKIAITFPCIRENSDNRPVQGLDVALGFAMRQAAALREQAASRTLSNLYLRPLQ